MTHPSISVIVPVHNVEDHVAACIDSLRHQSLKDFEAIVVDDGSDDDSPARIRAAIGDDPRFRVVRQANRGLSGARNTGLDAARGRVIAFLDGDDRFAPEFLDRMYGALQQSGADWVACGLRNIFPDGSGAPHPALHDRPAPPKDTGPRLWPLDSWHQVIAHFPSAWNKLYRRDLIDGLRFDEATWYEDHAFFCRAAARTATLLYLPEPLYLQTRGRAGQITSADSDRVFEQFGVLDTLAGIFSATDPDNPGKPDGQGALARLAHRLLHERSTVLADPARRARFVAAARDWLARHDLPGEPDDTFPPSWRLELRGTCPLSVIIPWDGCAEPLHTTLRSLAGQTQKGFELLIVADSPEVAQRGGDMARNMARDMTRNTGMAMTQTLTGKTPGPGPARNAGLAAAQGELVVFLDAGDRLMPDAFAHWSDTMLREGADFGLSRFRVGLNQGQVHSGFHDPALTGRPPDKTGPLTPDLAPDLAPTLALGLHCHPSARIYRRAFLTGNRLTFGAGPLESWQIGIGAALIATKTLYFAWPGVESGEDPAARRLWRAPVSPAALARALDEAAASWPQSARAALPADWYRRLYARALWEVSSFAPMSRMDRLWFMARAALIVHRRGLHRISGPLDPYLSARIRRLMGG